MAADTDGGSTGDTHPEPEDLGGDRDDLAADPSTDEPDVDADQGPDSPLVDGDSSDLLDADDGGSDAADLDDSDGPPATCPGLGTPGTDPGDAGFTTLLSLSSPDSAINVVFGGLALVDVDGDDQLDIVYTDARAKLGLLRRCDDGTFFIDEAAFAGVVNLTWAGTRTINYGDLDADGDPDLYVGGDEGGHILINQSAGGEVRFTDGSEAWQLGTVPGRGGGAFVDFDNDGDLDLYETSYESYRNRLLRNDGSHFTPITEAPGNTPELGLSLGAAWSDIDGDGLTDLLLSNDFGILHAPNELLLNRGPDPEDENGWLFEDVAAETGFQDAILGMGVGLGDVDNDGDLDVYVANIANNVFHIIEPDGTTDCPDNAYGFCGVDRAAALGVEDGHVYDPADPADWPNYSIDSTNPMEAAIAAFCPIYCDIAGQGYPLVSWTPIFFDLDQNGWLDLFVSNGYLDHLAVPIALEERNVMYLNHEGVLDRVAYRYFPNSRYATRGAAVGDLDGDGDLDLAWLDNGYHGPWRLRVLENQAATGNWLRVRLTGTTSNREGIGARLTLEAGELTLTREVDGGFAYASASERYPHFGLGDVTEITRLTIRWPSGIHQEIEDVPVNTWLDVVEPDP